MRSTTSARSTATTQFVYDGLTPVQELAGGSPSVNLLTGLGVDEYYTRTDSGGTSSYLTDALGSTIALAGSGGAVQTSYTYEPYGKTTVSGTTSSNRLRYTGRESDVMGLYHYRARYYNPTWGRFTAEDPVGIAGGSPNLYSYARNSPTRFIDPLGLEWWDPVDWGDEIAGAAKWGWDAAASAGESLITVGRKTIGWINERAWDPAGWWWGNLSELIGASGRPCGENIRCYDNASWLDLVPWATGATVGHTVFCEDQCSSELIRHETVHVRQFEEHGVTFPARYLVETIRTRSMGCQNRFEAPAYRAGDGSC